MLRLGQVADRIALYFCRVWGLLRPSAWSNRIARLMSENTLTVVDGDSNYTFIASMPLLRWRALTALSKEPATVTWIRSMTDQDCLWDIGANIGTYSIIAGSVCGKVIAFEPEGGNFSVLNRNIAINNLAEKVIAYPIAVAASEGFDSLRLHSIEPGAALHSFGTNLDVAKRLFVPKYCQGVFSTTIDELVYKWGLEFPTHVKIDVDGLEAMILAGAIRTLGDNRLRGLLVEINEMLSSDLELITWLESLGYQIKAKGDMVQDEAGSLRMRNYILEKRIPD